MLAYLIRKGIRKPFDLKKPVTFHNFSNLYLYIKRIIWVGTIAFNLIASTEQFILSISKKYKRVKLVTDITY